MAVLLDWRIWIVPVLLCLLLTAISGYNYLLFHTLIEIFTIIVSVLMFVVAAHTYTYSRQSFLMFLATGYFWVGALDLIHVLLYKGMSIYPLTSANQSTQFWIVSRYAEAFVLLLAPLFFTRRIHTGLTFTLFGALSGLFYMLITTGHFPDAYIEGVGLTPFKIDSEYLICILMLLALAHLYLRRTRLSEGLFPFLAAAIVLTIAAEISFTSYVSVYGAANMVGHIFKLFAFWLIYYSIVRVDLREPYEKAIAATRAMRESERKFRNLVETTSDCIWEIDRKAVYTYISPKVEEILGYRPEEVIGSTPFDLLAEPGARIFSEQFRHVMAAEQPFNGLRYNQQHKDGSLVLVESSGVPVFDDAGTCIGYRGIDRDITEHEQLEKQYLHAQKMDAIGTLVGGIAHDFNNTLAGITGNIFLAKKAAASNDEATSRLDNIEKLAFRAAQMIKQLLTFARQDSRQMHALSLSPFLKEAIKLQQATIPENIELHYNIEEMEQQVLADTNLLQQVLINLVNNARDAVEGIAQPKIEVGLRHLSVDRAFLAQHPGFGATEMVCMSIADNGIGIGQEVIEHIFEPFFSTKPEGQGTGLGLSMVFGAVRSHGGVIDVTSTPGKGSTFSIYLPCISPQPDEVLPDEGHPPRIQGQGETILLADDNRELLATARDVLQSLNYKVLTARDGEEAVRLFQSHADEIDLLMLDVVMPRMGGVEAFGHMRKIRPGIKALFATGYDRSDQLAGSPDLEDITVIRKPFSIDELGQTIRAILAESETL